MKNAEPKDKEHKLIHENKKRRKEKRKLMKMEDWLDDHATRSMETPR